MSTLAARSGLRIAAVRGGASRRRFASSSLADHHETYEAEKWEKITYAGMATCTVLAIYNLAKGGHPHPPDPPVQYPYMHIRNKDFPWGPNSLFETIQKRRQRRVHI